MTTKVKSEKAEQKRPDSKDLIVKIRIAQALSLGVFTLGLSMSAGDYAEFLESPIGTISITTTLFGLMGAIICEIMVRQAVNW